MTWSHKKIINSQHSVKLSNFTKSLKIQFMNTKISTFFKVSPHSDLSYYNKSDPENVQVRCNQFHSIAIFPTIQCIQQMTVFVLGLCPNNSTLCCKVLFGSVLVYQADVLLWPENNKNILDMKFLFEKQFNLWKQRTGSSVSYQISTLYGN